ncbi:GGDEF domain-containing protein [Vibrio sp. SM6]|uniref:diguanylate cyclase n=1 Tax=Vibrio agarilyticus TaxID=2726741 RepID=A0A7X8TR68_9VIBR|nr:GGDEF domain-containing protein [Vibrio agarilyticus]NLS13338.1 GGDEF domain-containing protein [Vibrio agarilyticus]
MTSSIANHSHFRIFIPLLLLTGSYFGMDAIIAITRDNQSLASSLPYGLLFTAFMLAFLFKQGRMAMLSIALFLCYLTIQQRLQVPLSVDNKLLELSLLTFLLPVAAALVYCFPREGLQPRMVMLYFLILALFVFWSYLLITHFQESTLVNWSKGLLFVEPKLSHLPVVLILYCSAVVGITAMILLRYNGTLEAAIYSSVVMSTATFIFFDVRYISSTMFTLSALLIIIYLVSASHVLAFMDALTGLSSRRMLDLDVKQLGRKFSIAMVDVDHFKKFNDTYGHATGDDVLKLVASCLAKRQSRLIRVYRYGGEEFTLLFRNRTAEQAEPILQELREEIANYQMMIRNVEMRPESSTEGKRQRRKNKPESQAVSVTISIGVCDSLETRDVDTVKERADEALYKAKNAGRNRVMLSNA